MNGVILLTDSSPECIKAAEILRWHEVPHEPVPTSAENFNLPVAMFRGITYQGLMGTYALLDNFKVRVALSASR